MLTVTLTCWDDEQYVLPVLLSWDLTYTASIPCDSFSAVCLYDKSMANVLPRATRFTAVTDGRIMLRGVVDAYEISMSRRGLVASFEGRGMAALLLDNESEAITYGKAVLSDVVGNHVAPYGIPVLRGEEIDGIPYAVSSGSSQWKAIQGFIHRAAGFEPYFTRTGQLVAAPLWGSGSTLSVNDESPILSLRKRQRRYGIISEVLLLDKTQQLRETVANEPFLSEGGSRRHVLYMPRSTADQRRYTGDYQIMMSSLNSVEISLELPAAFAAFPGDRISLSVGRLGLFGTYDVVAARIRMDGDGERTELILSNRGVS